MRGRYLQGLVGNFQTCSGQVPVHLTPLQRGLLHLGSGHRERFLHLGSFCLPRWKARFFGGINRFLRREHDPEYSWNFITSSRLAGMICVQSSHFTSFTHLQSLQLLAPLGYLQLQLCGRALGCATSVCLSINLSYPSVDPSGRLCIYLSICRSIYLSIYLI